MTQVTCYVFNREEIVSGPVYLIFYSCVWANNFLLAKTVQTCSWAHPASYLMSTGVLQRVKWLGCEVEHSPPSCAEVMNECLYGVYRDTLIIRSSLLTNARTVSSKRPRLHPFKPLPTYSSLIAFLFMFIYSDCYV
jgi:hypothetical protein